MATQKIKVTKALENCKRMSGRLMSLIDLTNENPFHSGGELGTEYLFPRATAVNVIKQRNSEFNYYELITVPTGIVPNITVKNGPIEIYITKSAIAEFVAGRSKLQLEVHETDETPIICIGRFVGKIKLAFRSGNSAFILEDGRHFNMSANFYASSYMHIHSKCSSNECNATISGASIILGRDFMLAHDITLQPSDQHDILSVESGELLNKKRSIILGDHVWVGKGAYLGAGARVGNGSVIGAKAVVVSTVDNNSVVAGNPARQIRTGISWKREFTTNPNIT